MLAAGQVVSPADLNTRGVEFYKQKQWEKAIKEFVQAYEIVPENETVRRNLCNAYQALANDLARESNFVAATELLNYAISVDPENPAPLTQLGSYYIRLDMPNEAIFRLEEAIELDESQTDALDLLGDAYYRANDLARAIQQWELLKSRQPDRQGLADKLDKAYREAAVESQFKKHSSQFFEISYAPGTSGGDVGRVRSILDKAYRDLGKQTGGIYPPTPIQVILHTTDGFAQVTQLGAHVGGVYDGKIRVPIADKEGHTLNDKDLIRVLYHEYTHVIVRFWVGDNAPWWLNEGLAETFSNDLDSSQYGLLNEMSKAGALFSLSELEDAQLSKLDVDSLHVAYLQSHAVVQYLWNRYGVRGLKPMFDSLAQGMPVEDALVQSYKLNYKMLDQKVRESSAQYASR
ncbi:MAG: hypothetical protein AMXMBFR84_46260 [Candidatus Hydrogenedentota bacterium]